MEKKKILVIFTGSMEIGGIERSLLGLLDAFDYSLYEVDLFLYGHHGPLFKQINSHVNLLPQVKELSFLRDSFKNKVLNGCFYSAYLRLREGILHAGRCINFDRMCSEIVRKCVSELETEYDIALSFFRPFDIIMDKVRAKVKVGWIHTDYSSFENDLEYLYMDYARLDYIAAVSEQCRESFIRLFPSLSEKTIVIENIMSKSFIEDASSENIENDIFQDSFVNLLSVGRFCEAKNFDNVPSICRMIRDMGLNIRWYLIGYGSDESLIRQHIAEEKMEDYVIVLGKKENPYPYIKACDLYVQPSRYEGKCVSVIEAQILHKPVIITNYPTAVSQLVDGEDGIIVPIDNRKCADKICMLIKEKSTLQKMITNTYKRDYSNSNVVSILYKMIEMVE